MRLKLFLLLLLSAALPMLAQTVKLQGSVVDSSTGAPLKGATVTLRTQGLGAASMQSGDFFIDAAKAGADCIDLSALPAGIYIVKSGTAAMKVALR